MHKKNKRKNFRTQASTKIEQTKSGWSHLTTFFYKQHEMQKKYKRKNFRTQALTELVHEVVSSPTDNGHFSSYNDKNHVECKRCFTCKLFNTWSLNSSHP